MRHYRKKINKREIGRFNERYTKNSIDGKIQYVHIYAMSYDEVIKKSFESRNPPLVSPSHKNLKEFLFCWLNHMSSSIKESTLMLYQNIIETHLIPTLGKTKLQKLTSLQIIALLNNKKHLSPKTIHNIFNVLNGALSHAKEENIIAVNPCKTIKLPKLSQKPIEIFTIKQQKKIESKCDIGVLICLYTGLRIGEICALK